MNMKLKQVLVSAGLALLLTACGDKDKSVTEQTKETASNLKEKASETKAALLNSDTRENFEAEMNKQLDEAQATITDLEKDRDSETVTKVREAKDARIKEAKSHYAELQTEYADFKKDTAEDWKAKRGAVVEKYDSVQAELKSAIDRNKAEAEMREKLDKLNAKIDALKADAKDAKDDAKAKLDADIKTLEEKKADLSEKFEELQDATKEKWETLKNGLSDAFDDVSKTFKDIFN